MNGKITSTPINVRRVLTDDLPEIVEIEREAFPHRPWSLEEWIELLASRAINVLVCEWYGTVVGYIATTPRTTRGVVWIVNLAVDREHRRHGVGSLLLSEVAKGEQGRSATLAALVRETNAEAVSLFRFSGFVATLAPQPYEGLDEDGFEFRYPLRSDPKPRPLRRVAR